MSRNTENTGAGAGATPWLVHETHHDVLIGVGDHAIAVPDAVCTRYR